MLLAAVPLLLVMRQLDPLVRVMGTRAVPEAHDQVMAMVTVLEIRSRIVQDEVNRVVVPSRRPIHSRTFIAPHYGYPPRVFLILGGFFCPDSLQ